MRLLLFLGLSIAACLAAPQADLVQNLPGLNFVPNFNSYSGYLQASAKKYFHYWFTESQASPSNDPLMLWLNGGPGCSSVGGLIEELGPFHVMDNGNTVYLNKYAWNRYFNVLFIESPAGVGYSYDITGKTDTDDDEVSLNNYNSLVDFLNKFPEYKGRDFYITGESYGGIYLPTLGARIIADKTNFPNFKGMAIGNGVVNFPNNYNTMVPLYYQHALIRDECLFFGLYNNLSATCCNGNVERCDIYDAFFNATCRPLALEALDGANGLDAYNLYSTCYLDGGSGTSKRGFIENALRKVIGLPAKRKQIGSTAVDLPLCAQTENTQIYMNRADVRSALHIPSSLPKWTDCDNNLNYTTTHMDVTPEILAISNAGVKILLYNGDVDTVCNHAMNRQFLTALNKTEAGRERVNEPWFYVDEYSPTAGFVEKFDGNIDFVTVRGSGHFVPEDKPRESLQMIYNFAYNRAYSSPVP